MKKRLLSLLLAISMVIGIIITAVPSLSALRVYAEEDEEEEEFDYLNDGFNSKEAKLDTMNLMLERFGYELYYESYTGEVAIKNTKTGEILMTNPYDVGNAKASDNIKHQLLSQIILKYQNNEGNEVFMYSYVEAALRGQIKVKYIKNGIRVEYVMGKQESRSLVPRYIEKERFETLILANITDELKLRRLKAFYVPKDPEDKTLTEKAVTEMHASFPITEKMAIYVFDKSASEKEINDVEAIIKEFCPAYTYEELEYDHTLTEYESEDKNPVQFRMSLEYTLDEDGLSVRLPANGIRFDQDTYQLSFIRMLPYMGAASSEYTGYTLIPDGTGTLVRFEDILKTGTSRIISGKLYGADYAYHTITGANQQVMRMPVFGLVENKTYSYYPIIEDEDVDTPEEKEPAEETSVEETPVEETPTEEKPAEETPAENEPKDEPKKPVKYGDPIKKTHSSGYVAIIEEGESLATITSDHGGNVTHKYNSVYVECNPRPKDSYNLASSISVAGDATWTVVSERKYTGSLTIRYIMLSDPEYLELNGLSTENIYDASYIGMALAYRDQLIKNGVISKLDNASQIPLYLTTLGVMEAEEKILSVPVTVKKPLTTFDDIKTIINELGEKDINNIVCQLIGYTNGGMVRTAANKIKVEKKAGGKNGLTDLIEYGKDKNIDFFLDTDYSYVQKDKAFDGFLLKDDAVRTIDNRYTQKRVYVPQFQYFSSTGLVAVSPSLFTRMFERSEKTLEKIGVNALSLGTMGSDLNSDFDEDDPYNREDSKENVIKALETIKEAGYKIMVDAGNAYTIKYANHVINLTLTSSNYTYASERVPFFGLVYHGYLNYAGSATNTAGDIRTEKLRILENGANPYFILVYQNSEELKEDANLSKYFSISYENWREDIVDIYNELNNALSLVYNSPLKDHDFLIGERVPSEAEKAKNDELDRLEKEKEELAKLEEEAEKERKENLEKHLAELTGKDITEETEEETEEPDTFQIETEAPETSEGEETSSGDETTVEEETTAPEEEGVEEDVYEYTRYTVENGMIVKETFENGYTFILNYNVFDVTVEETGDTVIGALGYIVLDANGNVVINSAKEAA